MREVARRRADGIEVWMTGWIDGLCPPSLRAIFWDGLGTWPVKRVEGTGMMRRVGSGCGRGNMKRGWVLDKAVRLDCYREERPRWVGTRKV